MGKRKSRAKPPPKKRMDRLETVFCCPFCNHGSSVECRIDNKNSIGEVSCRICQESFSTTVTGELLVISLLEHLQIWSTSDVDLLAIFHPRAAPTSGSFDGSEIPPNWWDLRIFAPSKGLEMEATALTEPIDIYSEWIDECERVNNVEDEEEG